MVSTVTHILCRRVWFALIASFLALQVVSLKALANNEYQCQALFVFSKPITDLVEFKSNTEIATNDIKLTDEMFKVLAHECVHISQRITGDLAYLQDSCGMGKVIWKNEFWKAKNGEKQPWEVEAEQLQDELVRKWKDQLK